MTECRPALTGLDGGCPVGALRAAGIGPAANASEGAQCSGPARRKAANGVHWTRGKGEHT